MLFDTFWQALQPVFPSLTLQLAIQCITAHSNKGVLLLVDEIMKCSTRAKRISIHDIVSQIGDCLDNTTSSQFNTVVTTLNAIAFKGETAYGRKILFFKLSPATLAESMVLFLNDRALPP
jgi:hypothetical protein